MDPSPYGTCGRCMNRALINRWGRIKGQIEGEWLEVALSNSHVQQLCMQVTIPTSWGTFPSFTYLNWYLQPSNYIFSWRNSQPYHIKLYIFLKKFSTLSLNFSVGSKNLTTSQISYSMLRLGITYTHHIFLEKFSTLSLLLSFLFTVCITTVEMYNAKIKDRFLFRAQH